VPMSHVKAEKTGWLDKMNLYPEHIDLLKVVARHSIFWARDIVNKFYFKGLRYSPIRLLTNYFINYAEKKLDSIEPDIERYKEMLRAKWNEKRLDVLRYA